VGVELLLPCEYCLIDTISLAYFGILHPALVYPPTSSVLRSTDT
jgi:hypothetical protein